jgi:YidC/Oxa1 family membrane protein insertase
MTDTRRTILWVVFSMSLFLLWDAWRTHNGEPPFFGPPRVTKSAPAGATTPPVAAVPGAVPTPNSGASATAAASPTPTASIPATAAAPTETVTITTDLVKATLDSRGGSLDRLELLQQKEELPQAWFESFTGLFSGADREKLREGRQFDVVLFDRSAARSYVAESGLVPPAGGAGLPNHHTPMTIVPGERTLQPGKDALQVKFESAAVGGVKLIKTYTFHRGSYVVDVSHQVVNEGSAPVSPRLYLQLVRDGNAPEGGSSFYSTFTGPAVYTDGSKFQKVEFKTIEKHKPGEKPDHVTEADNGWVAMVQHYFVSAWLVDKPGAPPQAREFFTGKVDTNMYSVGMFLPVGELAPGASKTLDARLFAGPQEENQLSTLAPGLELVKDYGIFKILAEPLFWLLTQLHKLIGNWGWSIVGLVVLLKIAFFWLNATAYRSMAKMKAINPKIMEMRERLKDKPQQMQQEMMRIYREEKVNPLGGCLPILAQMPFFISLYWVLLSSVEMRHAPWIGWIADLSARDPFFILPLLMTATSVFQVWLNPTPPDPVQAKMMWIMPLVFSVMFFVFPAGLVLYWLTNNILSIAQQWLINKKLGVIGK